MLKYLIKNYDKFIILFLSFVIIYIFISFSSYNCFFGDDAGYSFGPDVFNTLFGAYRNTHGGGYFGMFCGQFFCFFLPNLLHIHPSDFIGIPCAVIKGFFCTVILLLIARFGVLFKKSNLLYLSIFIFLISYLLYSSYSSLSDLFVVNYCYYRYFFYFIFYSVFWLFIVRNLLCIKNNDNYFLLFFISVLGYICGTGVEIAIFQCISITVLIFLHNLLFHLLKKDEFKFNINKNFIIPSVVLYIAAYLFVNNEGYKMVAADRGMENISVTVPSLIEFLKLFIKLYILDMYIYWVIFGILFIICCYFAFTKKEKNVVFLPLYFQISTIILINSLILCGKTNYDLNFFLTHNNILLLYKILLLFPLLYCISFLVKSLPDKNKMLFPVLFLISFLILIMSVGKPAFDHYTALNHSYKNIKTNLYISEKMLRFYFVQNKIPILPYIKDGSYPHMAEVQNPGDCITTVWSVQYYAYTYKDESAKTTEYCLLNDAFSQFYKNGGVFYEYEFDNLKFQRLLNDDFVLNKTVSKENISEKFKL